MAGDPLTTAVGAKVASMVIAMVMNIRLCLFSPTSSWTNQFDLFYFLLHNIFRPSGPDHVLGGFDDNGGAFL